MSDIIVSHFLFLPIEFIIEISSVRLFSVPELERSIQSIHINISNVLRIRALMGNLIVNSLLINERCSFHNRLAILLSHFLTSSTLLIYLTLNFWKRPQYQYALLHHKLIVLTNYIPLTRSDQIEMWGYLNLHLVVGFFFLLFLLFFTSHSATLNGTIVEFHGHYL